MLEPADLEFVILAAGKSTRNYPHSKGIPHKALVPFGSIKVIDHIIREPIRAGVKNITIVVSDEAAKEAFETCFEREPRVEEKFKKAGNIVCLGLLQSLYVPDDVKINYVIQREPKGLAHAVGLANKSACGRHLVVRLPDDVVVSHCPDGEKPAVERAIEQYIKDGIGGNLFMTRFVEDPSRWGIIENGVFREKPKETTSHEASHTLLILDKEVGARLQQVAEAADTDGTPEYDTWNNRGSELHYGEYVNEAVRRDPRMAIRTYPLPPTDRYLDCGTLKGYEEALIYTLLNESVFKRENREIAESLLACREGRR